MRSSAFDQYYRQLVESDPEIQRELEAEGSLESLPITEAVPGAEAADEFSLETIVLTKGRPVLDIEQGTAVIDINEIESEVWKSRLTTAAPFLSRGIASVGRIELANSPGPNWVGTGWVIRENIVVTNRHVAQIFGEFQGAEFVFKPGLDDTPIRPRIDFLEEFGSDASREFPLFKIVHIESGGGPDLAFLRIEPVAGQSVPDPVELAATGPGNGDQVAVIGYPARDSMFPKQDVMDRIFNSRYDKKRLAPGLVIGGETDRVFHDCSTLGGNSGGQVISLKDGRAVALHFAGTLFAKNHAVPIDRVVSRLDDVLAGHIERRSVVVSPPDTNSPLQSPLFKTPQAGVIEATIPIHIRISLGDLQGGSVTTNAPLPSARIIDLNADDDQFATVEARPEDYLDRKGYQSKFLGNGFEVPLPELTENLDDVLEFGPVGKRQQILKYDHFSVLMSISRRMCRFSACNIDGKLSKRTTRSGWQFDPRIPKSAQIMKECYGNPPKFSRGHMTRREDPAWGKTQAEADRGNSDSMHVTNTVPQIQPFNGGVWLALEDYALQNARKDKMQICVFTGPFLAKNDPIRFNVKVPISFWKVIAFIHDQTGELCATGYTMSQKSFLTEEEFVFGRHEHAQHPIHVIEARAGISFGGLAELDPLKDRPESLQLSLNQLTQIRFI